MESLQYRLFSGVISKLPIKLRLQILYYRKFKKFINYSNPQTFNEKIQLKKIHDRSEYLTLGADKLAAKAFVKEIAPELYIPKTLWVAKYLADFDMFPFDEMPDNYVLKANHTSQTIEFVRNGNHFSKQDMKVFAKRWFKKDQSGSLGEWGYQNIPPRVFAEEFLDFNGTTPDDYKLHIIDGKVEFIQLDQGRFGEHFRNHYDRDWNELGITVAYPRHIPTPEKPEFIDKMIEIAERIGQYYDMVRVDLYFHNNQITFSELTMYPAAGFAIFPNDWDQKFGKRWIVDYPTFSQKK